MMRDVDYELISLVPASLAPWIPSEIPQQPLRLSRAYQIAESAVDEAVEGNVNGLFVSGTLDAIAMIEAEATGGAGGLYSRLTRRQADEVRLALRKHREAKQGKVEQPSALGFTFLSVSELRRRPTPLWRVLRVIPARGLVVLYGASGSGKTFLALDIAAAVVRGRPWAERRTKKGCVAYVAAEGQLQERIDAYMQEGGLTDDEMDGLRVLDSAVNLLDPSADIESLIFSLRALAEASGGIAAVMIDTLNRVMPGGNENSSEDMGMVVSAAKQIERELDCAVIFIHHSGKDEARGSRGHSSLKAATDAELFVKRDGDIRTITAEKVRDGADGEVLMTFRLHQVDLGPMSEIDPEAEPSERRTSCVVVATDSVSPAKGAGVRLSDTDEIALRALKALCADYGEVTPATSLHPAGLLVTDVDEWRERFRRVRGVEKEDGKAMEASKKAFQRAVDKLLKLQLIGVHETRVWLW